jgi:hypothetical protein
VPVKGQGRADGQLAHGVKTRQIHKAKVAALGNPPLGGGALESVVTHLVDFAQRESVVLKGHHRLRPEPALDERPAL